MSAVARWLPVPGWKGWYEVSNDGRVKSLTRESNGRQYGGKILAPVRLNNGYVGASLTRPGKREQRTVHSLVLRAFAGAAPAGMEACHKDGDRSNNNLANLRWDTRSGNHADKRLHGTAPIGHSNPSAKLTEAQARRVKYGVEPYAALSRELGMSVSGLRKVREGRTWLHL